MTLKTKVAQGLKWQAINIAGRQGISLIVFTTLARLLDPSAFGLLGLIGVYLGFVAMFADQGIGTALIQRQNLEQGHMDAAFWTSAGCSLILCCGTIALAGPISTLLGDARLAPLLRWSSLGLVIRGTSAVHSALLIKAMDFRSTTVRNITSNILGGILGIIMAFQGYGVWALVAQQLLSSLTGAILLWSKSTYRPTLHFSVPHFRQLVTVGWSTFATSLFWYFSSRFDQMVIGRFIGVPALGLYVIAGKLPELAKTVTHGPLGGVSLPALSKLQDDHKRMRETIYKGMELNATITFAVFVGLAAISRELVPFLFGEKWAAAAFLTSLLSLSAMINVLLVFVHPALLASGGAGRYVLLNVCHAVGTILACVLGVKYGIPYLIVAVAMVSIILAAPSLLFLRHRIGLSPREYCRPCLMPALASIVMFGAVHGLSAAVPKDGKPFWLLVGSVVLGASTYVGFLWIFKPNSLRKIVEAVKHSLKK